MMKYLVTFALAKEVDFAKNFDEDCRSTKIK